MAISFNNKSGTPGFTLHKSFKYGLLVTALIFTQYVSAQGFTPAGQRLKDLAAAAGIQIGYAARDEFNDHFAEEIHDGIVSREFDLLTPENALKWQFLRPQQDLYDFTNMDDLIAFSETNAIDIHGHPLLWHRINPDWLDTLALEDVEADMNSHIDAVVGKYSGKIKIWDVVNEGLEDTANGGGIRQNLWAQAMGASYINKAFLRARTMDPDAQLIYNEYGVIGITPKSDEMYAMIKQMIDSGIPIDGIGIQMHLQSDFASYESMSANMQRFADLDLDIYLSELDVQVMEIEDYDLQADIYEKVVERCLLQPRCKAVQIWGVSDYYSFLPWFDPLLFDDDWKAKPAYFGVQKALSSSYLHPESASQGSGTVLSAGAVAADPFTAEQRWVKLEQIDLRPQFSQIKIRFRNTGPAASSLLIASESIDGPVLANFNLEPGTTAYTTLNTAMASASSVEDIYLVFGDDSQCVAIDAVVLQEPLDNTVIPNHVPAPTPGVAQSTVSDGELSATCNDPPAGTTDGGTTTEGDGGTTTEGVSGPTTEGNSNSGGGGALFLLLLILSFLNARQLRNYRR